MIQETPGQGDKRSHQGQTNSGFQAHHMDMRQAEEVFREMFRGFGMGDVFGGGPVGARPGTTSTSQEIVTKNGRKFLRKTVITNRPDGSSRTEIDETPL